MESLPLTNLYLICKKCRPIFQSFHNYSRLSHEGLGDGLGLGLGLGSVISKTSGSFNLLTFVPSNNTQPKNKKRASVPKSAEEKYGRWVHLILDFGFKSVCRFSIFYNYLLKS